MVVNFEFLGSEPIENVITCMKFKVDKVVFFGYSSEIYKQEIKTKRFLTSRCGINEENIIFVSLKKYDLKETNKTMSEYIRKELDANNQVYFDITGGEDLVLVAFGMLAQEYDLPMHQFSVILDELVEYENSRGIQIGKTVQRQNIKTDIDTLVELNGGVVNTNKNKDFKVLSGGYDATLEGDVDAIWEVCSANLDRWNHLSAIMRELFKPETEDLDVAVSSNAVIKYINEKNENSSYSIKNVRALNELLDALESAGALCDLVHEDGRYSFSYKSLKAMQCIHDGGSILEIHTYLDAKKEYSDARIGVNLDWDGIIHPKDDVYNEVDVLAADGNVLVFISCKSGKLDADHTRNALYELQTVADRFCGKYAKKILVCPQGIGDVHKERAEEMGIEVR